MKKTILALTGIVAVVLICSTSWAMSEKVPEKTARNIQAEKAAEAANSLNFTDNAEIDNIKKRLEITSKPGAMGYVVLLNESGQPILYEGVIGKITSGSKRLTDPRRVVRAGNGNGGYSLAVTDAPSDEGTYGSSGDYIFYWNTEGAYRQWSGKYLYSDKPFRLSIQPLVINTQTTASK